MKINILIPSLFFLLANISIAQNVEEQSKDNKEASIKETNRFIYFEIPSSINGSNLDPSAISNVTSNFSASKLSFKLGFPSLIIEAPETKDLTFTGFVEPSFKATNGVSTLYKAESAPFEYGLKTGVSWIVNHVYWVEVEDGKATDKHSSENMMWINFVGSIEQAKLNLFADGAEFDQILTKRYETNGSFYVSFNNYFQSRFTKKKLLNNISSIGIGYAKTNNYSSLKTRTLEEGVQVLDENETRFQSIIESTSGRVGDLVISEGFSAFGELFIPLIRKRKYGSIYFGNRLTFFGIGDAENITNGVTGLYFNLKDQKLDDKNPQKSAKDILNFSVTGRFNQLNNSSEGDYFKDNFTVVLQASIPLRFN